jgi:hypothetical protein
MDWTWSPRRRRPIPNLQFWENFQLTGEQGGRHHSGGEVMKICSVYERSASWYFQPESRTVTGLWIAADPVIELSGKATPEDKARAVRLCLEASRQNVPTPDANANLVAELLSRADVDSWAVFMATATRISIELRLEGIILIPYRKLSVPRGALESIPERQLALPQDSPESELGKAIEEVMARSL